MLLLTYGTTGDVFSYAALGRSLRKRGHGVVICADSRFEEFITRQGLECASMSDAITQLIDQNGISDDIHLFNGKVRE